MPRALACLSLLIGATACPGDPDITTESASAATEHDPGTSSGSTSTSAPTGGDATAGASTGDAGAGDSRAACLAWYEAANATRRVQCACEVAGGWFPSVEACMAEWGLDPACVCEVFAEFPASAAMLACYEQAASDLTACLEAAGGCPDGGPLQACHDQEGAATDACGYPGSDVCAPIREICGETGPFGSCASWDMP